MALELPGVVLAAGAAQGRSVSVPLHPAVLRDVRVLAPDNCVETKPHEAKRFPNGACLCA